jgi:hypothetical protein
MYPVAAMSPGKTCPTAADLRQKYDHAFRQWGKLAFRPETEDAPARLTAFEARNKAAGRLSAHQQTCPTCRREQMEIIRRYQ